MYKRQGTDNVWFYDMTADGFSLDDKRSPVADNDIPDIIARFRNLDAEKDRQRTEKSFFVPKAEIVDNGYDPVSYTHLGGRSWTCPPPDCPPDTASAQT